ncbi:synphilin-1 [Stigmatopora argus]
MELPEYLDLDEIDFSDDALCSVSSLKNIPELSRRNDAQAEGRAVPSINWSRGAASHLAAAGAGEAPGKFRPVKRVSPLKHQPENREEPPDGDVKLRAGPPPSAERTTGAKAADAAGPADRHLTTGAGGERGVVGELEHYDLDMDEILDVPFIKSSGRQTSTGAADERAASAGHLGGATPERPRDAKIDVDDDDDGSHEMCVLSPLKWSDLRKSKSADPDSPHLLRSQSSGGFRHRPHADMALSSSSSLSSFPQGDKPLSARAFPEAHKQRSGPEPPTSGPGAVSLLPLAPAAGGARGAEADEESKKKHNIINIVREGQISLLPHLAGDNLSLIRDEAGNNLLHVSASQGHAECLQHLTSLMGEDSLNERNRQQLTPAGLAVKNGRLECVRWMVSETEAIAELSCTREHPSLIHYAARYGQEKVLLWLLQFMQEQAISLDEVDQDGNTGVHVAALNGHLGCIQTLVEYGANVTVSNRGGERASQLAERQGHGSCARYLVVVETCMSLASQVVKLTKRLAEQAAENATLQRRLHTFDNGGPSGSEARPETTASAERTSTSADGEGPPRPERERKPARAERGPRHAIGRRDSEAGADEEERARRKLLPPADEEERARGKGLSPADGKPVPAGADAGPESPKTAAATASPKSALKSPSTRRKTPASLKLRVTFNENLHREAEPAGREAPPGGTSEAKRPFGALRSIMETLSGNANHQHHHNNNNNGAQHATHNQYKNKNRSANV